MGATAPERGDTEVAQADALAHAAAAVAAAATVAAADVRDAASSSVEVPPSTPEVPVAEVAAAASEPAPPPLPAPPPPVLPLVAVDQLDWDRVRSAALSAGAIRARMRSIVEQMEARLDSADGAGLLFDDCRPNAADRALRLADDTLDEQRHGALWIVGDLHGDLLALEAALALIHAPSSALSSTPSTPPSAPPRILFLGDFFDDEGLGLETVLRVFELMLQHPGRIGFVAGNHDEALSFDGSRFASSVAPSDFADFLNANRAHEWIERAGKLIVRLTALAPRALFFPDGLLVAHGGFPLVDLHPRLLATGDWNDPACLADFVWGRAHAKARRKMPNRHARGSQFGHEDFADFCRLAGSLGRPITHMARGHDHPEDRVEVYPAYHRHPVLTTVALSRRLPRERFGPYERRPTLARVVAGCLPQPYQLHVPPSLVREVFPMVATADGCDSESGEMREMEANS